MPIALTDDQQALADTVSAFVARNVDAASVRANAVQFRGGQRPSHWSALVDLGLHAIHLPERVGGQGGSMEDVAVVVAESARSLLPGPLLSTISASAIIAAATPDEVTENALKRFAHGDTGAVLLPTSTLTAVVEGDVAVVNGESLLTVGVTSAELLVVGADVGSAPDAHWFVIDRNTRGLGVECREGVDLTRDVGVVRFDAVRLSRGDRLTGIESDVAHAVVVALMAAEAAGVIKWCCDTAVAYIRSRHQFGRPVGTFQAVQHRAAQLLITSELAIASVWDAIRGLSDTPVQRTHAVAGAAVMSLGRAVHAAVECLGLHGAIGFTWEHDLHLYWRRAISLAALAGPVESWTLRLGEAAAKEPRNFAISWRDQDPPFADSVGKVLDQAVKLNNDGISAIGNGDNVACGPRRTLLADHGLVAPPLRHPFGLEASALQQLIVQEEFDRRGIERPAMGIAQWVLPLIVNRGSDTQVALLAEPTLRGEAIWCQLFSEPDAGSDLASLKLRATAVEGGWVLSGQKIWTTHAHIAQWGLCLARTGTPDEKRHGLSMFVIDMRNPAVEVRPIKQANNESEFNEVFFNDIFVPGEMLIGQPGEGWSLAMETLAYERLFIGGYIETGNERRLQKIVQAKSYAGSREAALQALGHVSAYGAAIAAMNLRETLRRLDGQGPGPATSISKAAAAQLHVQAAAAAIDLIGPAAALNESESEPVFHELDIPTWVIGGGTLEVQLNTIAALVMGLPRG